jgi:hypothetical protein
MYRDYYAGDHHLSLTDEMRKMLRVSAKSQTAFVDNYMQVVVDAMADRCTVGRVDADTDAASAWAAEILEMNRFDATQAAVHEATIRDGDTYVMVSWDNDARTVRLTHELAYDGVDGVLAVYQSASATQMAAAIKVWIAEVNAAGDTITRANVYYPDRVEKFISRSESGNFEPYVEDGGSNVLAWLNRDGTPIGIPLAHFRNRALRNYGRSELRPAVPLQDALNRNLASMVMSAELTAFQIRIANGFTPPQAITPGMWVVIPQVGQGEAVAGQPSATALPPADIGQFINLAHWTASEIGKITRTPSPEFGSDNASGESLKQKEIGLLGKVRKFQVSAGNAWENVLDLAWLVQSAYGVKVPPAYHRFYAQWLSPEIRNETAMIDNALKIAERVGERETLRLIADVYQRDEAWVNSIIDERTAERTQRVSELGSLLPGFDQFADRAVGQ